MPVDIAQYERARDTINFSHNWNQKLNCEYFTTIRLKNDKYRVGRWYEINLNRQKIGEGEIVQLTDFYLKKLSYYMCVDTGYDVFETKNLIRTMYKNMVNDWEEQQLTLILVNLPKERRTNWIHPAEKKKLIKVIPLDIVS